MLVKKLQRLYYLIISPAILLVLVFFVSERLQYQISMQEAGRVMSTAIMVFAAITSTILPVWYKIILIRKLRNKQKISTQNFVSMQFRIVITVSFSVYWIFPAYLYQLPEMPMVITAFFALYGLYYYYPSQKRIDTEKKIFKIEDDEL